MSLDNSSFVTRNGYGDRVNVADALLAVADGLIAIRDSINAAISEKGVPITCYDLGGVADSVSEVASAIREIEE